MLCGSCRVTFRRWRYGMACSARAVPALAGTKGKRFALPHARILMHRGWAGIGDHADQDALEVQADDLRHRVDTVLGLIAADTGQPVRSSTTGCMTTGTPQTARGSASSTRSWYIVVGGHTETGDTASG